MMSALEGDGVALATKQPYRYCDNAQHGVCNWLIPADSTERLCEACRHNRVIPDPSIPLNVERWGKIELAKRYVFR
ncbi:zinc-ribbon domain-containing protein, partial [Klebsiella pneumoniae]|nr:zinc-ribbon domain-containing protein [Klebsiella pneumoniae]